MLGLYAGTQVFIRVGDEGPEYPFSKDLLCAQSPYFAAMFNENRYKEGEEGKVTMCLIDGIVSVGSVETLIQWLYRGKAIFPDDLSAKDEITKVVEFARLCDMVDTTGKSYLGGAFLTVNIFSWRWSHRATNNCTSANLNIKKGMEQMLADHIKMLLLKPPPAAKPVEAAVNEPFTHDDDNEDDDLLSSDDDEPLVTIAGPPRRRPIPPRYSPRSLFQVSVDPEPSLKTVRLHYTNHILSEHLYAVSELPRRNPVRNIFATAVVGEYMSPQNGLFKFK